MIINDNMCGVNMYTLGFETQSATTCTWGLKPQSATFCKFPSLTCNSSFKTRSTSKDKKCVILCFKPEITTNYKKD